jgi:acetyl esterase/lipase
MSKKELTVEQKNKKYPMRLTNFHPGWMDMKPPLPVPIISWIYDKELDVPYGSDEKQKLDLYYPNVSKEKYPTMIIIHGGGWAGMDKIDWHLYPGFFALEEGFAVISINYRLAPNNKFPDGWNDVNNALELIIKNEKLWKIDLNNLFFWGASAGGNFVSMLGFKYASDPRIRIGGVASLCPVLDFGSQIKALKTHHFGQMKPKWFYKLAIPVVLRSLMKKYIGYVPNFSTTPIGPYDASYYIGSNIPPFYFQYGYYDPLIVSTLVEDYAKDLIKRGAKEEDIVCDCLKEGAHMGATHHYFDEEVIKRYISFYLKHLEVKNEL